MRNLIERDGKTVSVFRPTTAADADGDFVETRPAVANFTAKVLITPMPSSQQALAFGVVSSRIRSMYWLTEDIRSDDVVLHTDGKHYNVREVQSHTEHFGGSYQHAVLEQRLTSYP